MDRTITTDLYFGPSERGSAWDAIDTISLTWMKESETESFIGFVRNANIQLEKLPIDPRERPAEALGYFLWRSQRALIDPQDTATQPADAPLSVTYREVARSIVLADALIEESVVVERSPPADEVLLSLLKKAKSIDVGYIVGAYAGLATGQPLFMLITTPAGYLIMQALNGAGPEVQSFAKKLTRDWLKVLYENLKPRPRAKDGTPRRDVDLSGNDDKSAG